MKLLLGMGVLGAVALTAVYYAGGFATFDPNKAGEEARSKLKEGMTWKAVFTITGEPQKYRPIERHEERFGNEVVNETFKPGPENTFDAKRVAERFTEKSLPYGFMCTFRYSNRTAFSVVFDGDGLLARVEDALTLGDLLK